MQIKKLKWKKNHEFELLAITFFGDYFADEFSWYFDPTGNSLSSKSGKSTTLEKSKNAAQKHFEGLVKKRFLEKDTQL